ncbi:MAG: hypothetical protein FWF59_11445 [Turicibacter sp.]|nr:hypothetical protein [Turicibacter sp.]
MEIYIVLTKTSSVASKLIGCYTKKPYSHVSIAFDKELKQVYSFGRKRPNYFGKRNHMAAAFKAA